jgi:hypothetical protein
MTQNETIDAFVDKYDPAIARQFRSVRAKLRKTFPRGYELVYDNYNALAVAFSPTDAASSAVMSVAAYPKWVSVFFTDGAKLADPNKLLKGGGSRMRHIVLASPDELNSSAVKQLIAQAVKPYAKQFAAAPQRAVVVKSVSTKQRPRRPGSTRR